MSLPWNIPQELRRQCSERAALIAAMQVNGAITTPVGYLETTVLLVSHLGAESLSAIHQKLKRTRRRKWQFCLNARCYFLTRREALALVAAELERRMR